MDSVPVHEKYLRHMDTRALQNVCSAIDQLPSNLDFAVPPLSETTGLSQDVGNLIQSDACSAFAGERDSQSSTDERQAVTPDTSCSGVAKRRKGARLAEG